MAERAVIIGAGHAGTTLAASLRDEGYDGGIVLFGAEPDMPYHRPPLSKTFLTAEADDVQHLRPVGFYRDNAIDLRLDEEIRKIDLVARRVVSATGAATSFSRLAVATGGRPRRWRGENADAPGVAYLRSLDDARRIKRQLAGLQRLVVVGGGFIGLELAASLSGCGVEVTVLEAMDRLMARAVAPETSRHFFELHRGWGIELLLGEGLARLCVDAAGRLSGVETTAGRHIAASLAVVGIGLEPEVALCRTAGLACDDGVVVEECLTAGRDDVVAIGDCAAIRRGSAARPARIESVQNATDQARTAARSLLGRKEPYRAIPWFWSDQRQTKLQIAGCCVGAADSVVRGDPSDGRFSVLRYRGDRLVAVDSIDRPGEHLVARRLIAAGVSPSRAQAADPDFDLRTLFAVAPAPVAVSAKLPADEAPGARVHESGARRAR